MSGMLRKRRIAAGLSQTSLAEKSDIPMRTIQHWEHYGILKAQVGSVKRVADALGCTVDELIGRES